MSPEEAGGMAPPAEDADGVHEHAAPHGGALVELGEEFAHVEIVLDPASGGLKAYVLDGEAENAVRVALPSLGLHITLPGSAPATAVLAAKANALSGEAVGDTSQFVGTLPALKGATAFSGQLRTLTVKGQTFTDVAFDYPGAH